MGTNYYLSKALCLHCGRGDKPLHIGKSSAGWCFSLHVDSDEGITSLADWQALWGNPHNLIHDEYGDRVTPAEMLAVITERGRRAQANEDTKFYADNDAEPGPNGLLRHRLGPYCVGHGDGTYDLIPGEFS